MPLKTSRHAWTRLNSLQSGTQETAWISENKGASQKDKSHSETYSNKLSIFYREQGRRWQAPSPGASKGWASTVDTQCGTTRGGMWQVVTLPRGAAVGVGRAASASHNPGYTMVTLRGNPGIASHSSSMLHPAHGSTDHVHVTGKDRTVQVRVHVNMLESKCLHGVRYWQVGIWIKYTTKSLSEQGTSVYNRNWRRELTKIRMGSGVCDR